MGKGITGWVRSLEARADAWALARMTPEERIEALELDARFKRHFWRWAGAFAAAVAVLAALMLAIKPRVGPWAALGLSAALCFGLLVLYVGAFYGYRQFMGPKGRRRLALTALLAGLGVLTGMGIALLTGDKPFVLDAASGLRWAAVAVLVAGLIAFEVAVIAWMRVREGRQREARLAAEAERERLSRQAAQAELKMLQAQVEPHFLFNTLANLRFLVQTGSPDALAMLDHLIHYLRTAVPEMRGEASTVGREVELARAYLEILRLRMGGGLRVEAVVAADVAAVPIPPLMVMTLVENAVKHGVAPVGRGTIRVQAARRGEAIRIEVEDDGRGLGGPIGQGVGLANVRERLRAMHGERARLTLDAREGGGTVAAIEVPA